MSENEKNETSELGAEERTSGATRNDNDAGEVVTLMGFGVERKKAPLNSQSQTGGFSTHMRSDLARSAVIYLEQEDPRRRHREKVVCAVNVGDFELHYPTNPAEPEKLSDDGRTLRRKMWDEAVQALIHVIAEVGLNPKFVRNDKNSCRLVVKQEAISSPEQIPDEFFSMELFYCSEFELERRKLEHVKRIDQFNWDISAAKGAFFSWKTSSARKRELQDKMATLERDRNFFIATTPDPREMDSGLIFKVELFTLKEYGVVKEKLRIILGQYMAKLSKIAAENGTSISGNLKKIA